MRIKVGSFVTLKEDKDKEIYQVVEKKGISKGPMRQFEASRIWKVMDKKNHSWEFREDALDLLIK